MSDVRAKCFVPPFTSSVLGECFAIPGCEDSIESEGRLRQCDAWQRTILYKCDEKSIELISLGEDGIAGTEDDMIGRVEFNEQGNGTIFLDWRYHFSSVSFMGTKLHTGCN
ncbi:MAG: hypothetical protein IJU44_12320 [Kiritimatiellae bacterium]|nr:hypothetical protein [Kiritimatiellia bacterium]